MKERAGRCKRALYQRDRARNYTEEGVGLQRPGM